MLLYVYAHRYVRMSMCICMCMSLGEQVIQTGACMRFVYL